MTQRHLCMFTGLKSCSTGSTPTISVKSTLSSPGISSKDSAGQKSNKTAPSYSGRIIISFSDSRETLLFTQQVCQGPPVSPSVGCSTLPVPSATPVHPGAGRLIAFALKLNSAHSSKQSPSEETWVDICKSVIRLSCATKCVRQRMKKKKKKTTKVLFEMCQFNSGSIAGKGTLIAM